ncbi:MAG: flagellar export chaperone FliS [Planctomycetota bacterium]|nr:MAG: flagellar export chaperone FliS [Planctomycetota bacterium]
MNGIKAYQETAVCTQNRGQLIVTLYDGAINFLKQAIADLEQADYASKGIRIAKANDIILELNTVLDMDKGGQISQNLRSLYNFMHHHLSEANLKKDATMIQDVIKLLEELRQGWKTITN